MSVNSPIHSDNEDSSSTWDISPLSLTTRGDRKSAFLPYKPTTVLTNLQRGNTEANICPEVKLTFHERSGQGEITEDEAQQQINIDVLDSNHFTPLHYSCYYGQFSSASILIKYKADVNKLAPDLITPLLLAAAGGYNEIVRILLQHGAHINHMDIIGNTALMYAAAGNHPHTTNEILGFNPNLFDTNEDDETAYSLAVKNCSNLALAVLDNFLINLVC